MLEDTQREFEAAWASGMLSEMVAKRGAAGSFLIEKVQLEVTL